MSTPETTTKKTVILRAPLLTQSGYGVHSRQVAKWLFDLVDTRTDLEVVTEPLPWGTTPWIVDTSAHDGLIGRIVQAGQTRPKYDVSIQLQLPNEWNPFLADFNVGMTAAVEADKCNPAWVEAANKMDLVIVPSEFVKGVLTKSGNLIVRVEIVPEAFIDEILDPDLPQVNLDLDTKFNFLVFGQFTGNNPDNDRKNIFYTVKWLAEAFSDNPEVGVIVKTNMARNTIVDKLQATQVMSQLINEVKKGKGPKFYLLHGDMSNKEVAALYRHPQVKALVSLTHGEGFGLPLLEAAVSGLPVVATNWSAHTEFLGKGKYVKIDQVMIPVHQTRIDNQIFMPGVQWANPLEDDAKRKLKKFYESSAIPRQWAKELAETLKKSYSFDEIKKHYDRVFNGVI